MRNKSEAEFLETENRAENVDSESLLERQYRIKDLGDPDSLVNSILTFVVQENYDRAIAELRFYQKMKSNYPQFTERSSRYFDHCNELIEAIRTKYLASKSKNLPASKRQEFNQWVFQHFHELKGSLQKIVGVERDLRLDDARSTIWVIKTVSVCLFCLTVFAVLLEAFRTMRTPLGVLISDMADLILKAVGL